MGMPNHIRLKRRRRELFHAQGGCCHWCKEPMRLIEDNPGGGCPKDMATIDHLRDRFHPERRQPPRGEERYVAACWNCNNKRGAVRQAELGKPELQRRAAGRNRRRLRAPQLGINTAAYPPFAKLGEVSIKISEPGRQHMVRE
jgi:5-methylcytosine-specific restriction endonuclease McrA